MTFEKTILVALTTSPDREIKAPSFFRCTSELDMLEIASKLEGILDAVAHKLSSDTLIIVKHS